MTPLGEFQKFVYEELKTQTQKLDQLNSQVTVLRIEQAVTVTKIAETKKLHSVIFGMMGGIATAVIDLFFRR